MTLSCRPVRLSAFGLILFLGGCAGWFPLSAAPDITASAASGRLPTDQPGGLARAMLRVADMAAAHDDWRTAAAHYRRVAALSPDDPRPLTRLGSLLAAQGRAGDSETAFRAALDRDPASIAAKKGLARLGERRLARRAAPENNPLKAFMNDFKSDKKNHIYQPIKSQSPTVILASVGAPDTPMRHRVSPATDRLGFSPVTAADLAGYDDRPPAVPPESAPKPTAEAADEMPRPVDSREKALKTPEPGPRAARGVEADSGSGYIVQIAAYRSAAMARTALPRLSGRAADLLARATIEVDRADLGAKGVFFRIRTAVSTGKDAARRLCAALRGQGLDCFIARAGTRA